MRSKTPALLAASLLLLSLAPSVAQDAADPDLETLVSWLTGSFSSQRQSQADPEFHDVRLHVARIWPERRDGRWLYVEQAIAQAPQRPYRQRVMRIRRQDAETFVSQVYELPEPQAVIGCWRDAAPLAALTPQDLQPRAGAAVFLRRDGAAFVGGTRGRDCQSDFRGAAYATTEVRLEAGRMVSWDRGWDEEGEQVWGAVKGGYVFDRLSEEPAEPRPGGERGAVAPERSLPASAPRSEQGAGSPVRHEPGAVLYDEARFQRLVDFRVGAGEARYYYTFGDVRAQPGGQVLFRYEGYETCRLAPGSRSSREATQLSRRIFFYRDVERGDYVRGSGGGLVAPVAYPYLVMRWTLGDEGEVRVAGTQGTSPRVLRVDATLPAARLLSDGTLHLPVDLFFQAGAYSFHEVGTYVSYPPGSPLAGRHTGHFARLQPLPRWAQAPGAPEQVLLDLSVEEVASFEALPRRLQQVVRDEHPLYVEPPRDLAECEALQRGD